MFFNESREYKSPVLVDDSFLRAIRNALELAKPIVLKSIADSSGLTVSNIGRIASGKSVPNIDKYKLLHVKSQIASYATTEYIIKFQSGTSVQTSDFDEMMVTLQYEPSHPKSIEASIGKHSEFHISLSVGKWTHISGEFSARGSRENSLNIRDSLEKAFANAEPSYSFLHSTHLAIIIGIISGIIGLSGFALAGVYVSRTLNIESPLYIPALGGILSAMAPLFGIWVGSKFHKIFPRVSFTFGRQARKRQEAVMLIYAAITIFIVPLLFMMAVD